MKLSIIIVNTNEWHVLGTCLKSVFEQTTGIPFEVIVVDNASTDGSREKIAAAYPQVRIVANSHNLGFAAANNRGIQQATGEYVLLLNPDTEVLDRAISKTVEFMDARPKTGIAGCKLLFPDGTLQKSVRSFPTLLNVFAETTFLYRLFPKSRVLGAYYLSDFHYDAEREVDWVCGAYLMIRRSVIDRIGILDEQFYMYTEEVDYCYRAYKAGFEIWFVPGAEVYHFWAGYSAINKRIAVWSLGSQILFFQKHFHGVERLLLIALKCVGTAIRIPIYLVAGIVSLNRKLLAKSYYALYALYQMVAAPWRYLPGYTGPVTPWRRF